MKEETYGIIWGSILLVLGLIILLIVFSNLNQIVQNPVKTLDTWVPEEIKDPTASFSWSSNNLSAYFNDASIKGSAEIIHWQWEFGDDTSSNEQNPSHQYSGFGDYLVNLRVEDQNGKSDAVETRIFINDQPNMGQTQGGATLDLGLDKGLKRFAIIVLFICIYAVIVMIGGRFMLAGCRLLRPVPKNIKLKIRASDMVVENVSSQKNEPNLEVSPQSKDKKSWFRRK
jgi:PKD repeat protein